MLLPRPACYPLGHKPDSQRCARQGHLCIVTDYCEAGDLYAKLKGTKGFMREDAVLDLFSQIALALAYVHEQRVLHRDLKTQNVFLHRNGTIKLGDFGVSRHMEAPVDMAMTVIGTPYYMSPELMEGKPYGYKSDVWALGCVLYELATLKHAFDANDMNGLVMKIVRGRVLPVPMHYSQELRSLISKLLAKRPADRPTLKRVLEAPVLAKYVAKHRAAIAQRRAEAQPSPSAGPSAPAAADGSAASGASSAVARSRADARARLEREIASHRDERLRLEGDMGKLAEGNRKLGAQLKVQGGAAGVRGGEPRAAAVPGTPVNLQDAIRRKERELRALSHERHHVFSARRRMGAAPAPAGPRPNAADRAAAAAAGMPPRRHLVERSDAGNNVAHHVPASKPSAIWPPLQPPSAPLAPPAQRQARDRIRIIPQLDAPAVSLEEQVAAHRERRRQRGANSGSDSDRSHGSGGGGALSDRSHGSGGARSARSDGSSPEVTSKPPPGAEDADSGGPGNRREVVMEARRRKKKEEAAKREAELLAARRSYFEERKAAHRRNNSDNFASDGNVVVATSFSSQVDRNAVEAEMVVLQAQHLAVTRRIEELQETIKGHDRAGAIGGAAQQPQQPQRQSSLDTPAARELDRELEAAPRGNGVRIGDGLGAARVEAVRAACEHHLGKPLLSKLLSYMRERNRMLQEGEEVCDAAFHRELRAQLGADRMEYVNALDQLSYLEMNHPAAGVAAKGQHVGPTGMPPRLVAA